MDYTNFSQDLSDEAKTMLETARRFGKEVLRPTGIELDLLSDPADVIAEDSALWDVFRRYREIGFHLLSVPKELGGLQGEIDHRSSILIYEELAYWDVGLAASLIVSAMPFYFAALIPNPSTQSLIRDFIADKDASLIGCWCLIEPDHGSDWILHEDPGLYDPKIQVPSLRAEKKGDEYILNGQKAAWVSNGSIATHGFVHLNIDSSMGMRGDGIALVPLDLPGITRGKPLNKLGQRPLNQGEIFFNDVKLPAECMIVDNPAMATMTKDMVLVLANTQMGIFFSSLAKAAYDLALEYARERIQGGKPIFEHKNIKLKLFNMYIQVESARTYARSVALHNATNYPPAPPRGISSKILATETAFKVASDAIQIFGGNGLAKEYPIEKIFRDARASLIEDGENDVLALSAAAHL